MEIQNPAKDSAHGKELNKMDLRFWYHYRIILQDSINLTEDRQESYVGDGNCILEQAICGEAGYVYEINKKNHRLKGLYQLESKGMANAQKTADSVEDTLLDIINHAAFHLAYRRMIAEGSNVIGEISPGCEVSGAQVTSSKEYLKQKLIYRDAKL